jgi:hypothetical protein
MKNSTKSFIFKEINLQKNQIMAKCKNCDYPYASINQCTNCGSKNPTGRKGSFIGGLIAVIILVMLTKCGS